MSFRVSWFFWHCSSTLFLSVLSPNQQHGCCWSKVSGWSALYFFSLRAQNATGPKRERLRTPTKSSHEHIIKLHNLMCSNLSKNLNNFPLHSWQDTVTLAWLTNTEWAQIYAVQKDFFPSHFRIYLNKYECPIQFGLLCLLLGQKFDSPRLKTLPL